MKLKLEILSVSSSGDTLELVLQGTTTNAARWRAHEKQTLRIPYTKASIKAFHVGRIVTVEVKP